MMKEELEKKLIDEFPFLARKEGSPEPYDEWGFETGNGWYELLRSCFAEIAGVFAGEGREVSFQALQIKEKFGTLRIYYKVDGDGPVIQGFDNAGSGSGMRLAPGGSDTADKVREIVQKYEALSGETCEVCGGKGELRKGLGRIVPLCDEHYEQRRRLIEARRAEDGSLKGKARLEALLKEKQS